MSDDYLAAVKRLEQAVQDVISSRPENDGAILTHWVAVAASHIYDEENDQSVTGYSYIAREDVTPHYVALGLFAVGESMVKETFLTGDDSE